MRAHTWIGVTIDDLEHLGRWYEAVDQRPAVQRGMAVPVRDSGPGSDDKRVETARKLLV